ncbi:hypothetical protein ACFPT7_03235 [Acidicapsa dinghuensis]|uniref:Uncharacterized protein n=1 Tax=Acidicapsa dinghuensis TaxID=2218256 RepID=A0ABW1EDD9_9BACT|nr:hypothetical protein [Acidicapsa dinghuensis]
MPPRPDFILDKQGDVLRLRFLSSRAGTVITLLLSTGAVLTPVILLSVLSVNGMILSLLWGGSLSIVITSWFVIVPMVARVEMEIESDVIRMQRTWFRIPLGAPSVYPRNALTDLGGYFKAHGGLARTCVLSLWHNGNSIELERTFPLAGLRRLRWELSQHGVEFTTTLSEPEFEMQPGGKIMIR